MVRSRQWTIYGVVGLAALLAEKVSPLSRGVEKWWVSLGVERRAQVMEGGQQDGAVELDSEDGMRSSGEKGWESVPAPTAHCKHTNTPWVRVASSLGALGAWIPGVVWFCLGTAWIFRGGRWRLQTCADAETQGLGSKKRKRGMEGRKVHFCKSLGGAPGSQVCTCSSTGWSCHGPPPASKGEGANPWAGISSCSISGR